MSLDINKIINEAISETLEESETLNEVSKKKAAALAAGGGAVGAIGGAAAAQTDAGQVATDKIVDTGQNVADGAKDAFNKGTDAVKKLIGKDSPEVDSDNTNIITKSISKLGSKIKNMLPETAVASAISAGIGAKTIVEHIRNLDK